MRVMAKRRMSSVASDMAGRLPPKSKLQVRTEYVLQESKDEVYRPASDQGNGMAWR